jgi:hypothetical protein
MEGMRSDLLCFPISNKAVVVMDLTLVVGLNIDFGSMFFVKPIILFPDENQPFSVPF